MVFNLTFKKALIIHMIIILILIGLMIKIKSDEEDYACENCKVNFKGWMEFGEEKSTVEQEVRLNYLYERLEDCPVIWDSASGWIIQNG